MRRRRKPFTAWGMIFLLATAWASCSNDDDDDANEDPIVDDDDDLAPPSSSGPIRVMSFNLLCSFCDPANYDPWETRLDYFEDLFDRHAPDLVGSQELFSAEETQQVLDLLPGFEVEYYRSEVLDYPDSAIFYDADRFEVLEWGVYWLSPTPEEPYSTGFGGGSQLARLVTWAHMRQSDGWEFFWANTHFDNNSPSQEKSAPLLMERTLPWAEKMPALVTGDFNSKPDREAYRLLTEGADPIGWALANSYDLAPEITIDSNLDARPIDLPPLDIWTPEIRIDHIFVGGLGEWEATEWTVDTRVYGESYNYPSDHRAILTELVWSE